MAKAIELEHLHDKTKVLPIDTHLKLHATQLKQLTQIQTHPLHDLNAYSDLPTNMKATIFHSNEHFNIIISDLNITPEECRENLKHIHITITSQYLSSRKTTKLLTLCSRLANIACQTKCRHSGCKASIARPTLKSRLVWSYGDCYSLILLERQLIILAVM